MIDKMKLPTILAQNPIIASSLRDRRLNWRFVTALALATLTYCPAVLISIPYLLTALLTEQTILEDFDEFGRIIFFMSMIFLLVLVTLFAPVMSVSAIAGEKQRQTLDLLVITLLPARSIVMGKLVTALIYTFLLLAAAWPLLLLCLMTGGVALIEFVVAGVILFVTAIAFTTIGLFVSSLGKTTTNATMLTYGLVLPGILIGPFLCMLPVTIFLSFVSRTTSGFVDFVNFYGWSLAASLNPITAAVYSAMLREEIGGVIFTTGPAGSRYFLVFPWVICIIFYSIAFLFLVRFTTRRLDQVNQT
jgi:ABC-type transport system involved in multi-copper enzyme maturation permease subunit